MAEQPHARTAPSPVPPPAPRIAEAVPRVLSIAGTDPSGGAGIQADMKAFAAHGAYGMSAVTALVSQNTHGVREVHAPGPEFLRSQLEAVSDDVEIDAVKIGMLFDEGIIAVVAEWLDRVKCPIVVLDPVMVATSGDRLLVAEAEEALRGLLPKASLITPNVPELAVLAGAEPAADWDGVLEQARSVARSADVLVLAKGGHLDGDTLHDALVHPDGTVEEVAAPRVDTTCTHGTGCSLSSAVAALWPRLGDPAAAVRVAKQWLTESLEHAAELRVGSGHGPVNHFAGLWGRGLAPANPEIITDAWWEAIDDLRSAIDDLPFIAQLADGSLDGDDFAWYLAQDAVYLNGYSRALAAASTLAPTQAEQMFWANSAHSAIATEMELHRSFIGDAAGAEQPQPSAVTRAYVDHLLATAARGSYGEAVAALLPCYWLYQEIGSRLAAAATAGHPYEQWLATYSDEEFEEATRAAIGHVARAAAGAGPEERAAMWRAFRTSSWHELEFFAEPVRRHG
ncbi:bifunctional hydroxymethylpyrimidine kinase/phosphomethylpyrimidine kinase [Corynebacterium sp. 335C]